MMFDSLPVIIVTAKTKAAAEEMITELVDSDATAEARPAGHASADRVWRLVTKYYTALVRLRARADGPPPAAEGHVALLARDELAGPAAARRLPPAGAAPVSVLACDVADVPAALLALCAARRAEPVALRAPPAAGPFAEPGGAAGVRAALQAHAWPGLRRAPPAPAAPAAPAAPEERFARALAALGGAAARGARLQGAERRAAAERLVAAFARAVGQPLADPLLDLDLPADLHLDLALDLDLDGDPDEDLPL